jgi:hypothetical protein
MEKKKVKLHKCSRGHEYPKSKEYPVCPICWIGYYRRKAGSDFPEDLAAPALRALLEAKLVTLTDLSKVTEKEVKDLHGMGPKALGELKKAMKKGKVAFKKEVKTAK